MSVKSTLAKAAVKATGAVATGVAGAATMENQPVKGMHEQAYQGPDTAERIAYRNKLATVSDSAKTADNVLSVVGSPKKTFGLMFSILLILLTVVLVWIILGKQFKSMFKSAKTNIQQAVSQAVVEQTYGKGRLNEESAAAFADSLYSLFGNINDQNDAIVAKMKTIETVADYYLIRTQWGTKACKKPFYMDWLNGKHDHDLIGMLTCNLNEKRRSAVKEHLLSIGVTDVGGL